MSLIARMTPRENLPAPSSHSGLAGRPKLQFALRLGALAAAYFLAHRIAFLFPDAERVLMAVWPAGGIGLAVLLLRPRREWLAILSVLFAAGNLANLTSGRQPLASLGFMTANVLESLACAWMILRWCGPRVRFERVRDIMALLAAATLANASTAFIGAATAVLVVHAAFWDFYWTWWDGRRTGNPPGDTAAGLFCRQGQASGGVSMAPGSRSGRAGGRHLRRCVDGLRPRRHLRGGGCAALRAPGIRGVGGVALRALRHGRAPGGRRGHLHPFDRHRPQPLLPGRARRHPPLAHGPDFPGCGLDRRDAPGGQPCRTKDRRRKPAPLPSVSGPDPGEQPRADVGFRRARHPPCGSTRRSAKRFVSPGRNWSANTTCFRTAWWRNRGSCRRSGPSSTKASRPGSLFAMTRPASRVSRSKKRQRPSWMSTSRRCSTTRAASPTPSSNTSTSPRANK